MKFTWALIQQFVHCKRQWRLFYYNLKTEHTSENVKIWKILHELKYWWYSEKNFTELWFEDYWIKIDKINFKNKIVEIEEFKKANKDIRWQAFQVLYYLYIFEKLWIKTVWKLIFDEKHKIDEKQLSWLDYKIEGFKIYFSLTDNNKNKLLDILKDLENTLKSEQIPPKLTNWLNWPHKKCRWCSYYSFCWI